VTNAGFDATVLGAGPIGLIAALQCARSGRKVIIRTRRLPDSGDPPRVDCVPTAFLALLVELGISPARVGADRLHDRRLVAWRSAEPELQAGPKTAHVERPALDLALLEAVRRQARIAIEVRAAQAHRSRRSSSFDEALVIDASGRAAVSTEKRFGLPRPLVARTFWTARHRCHAGPGFLIAALPDGYGYRLAGASIFCLGMVGRGAALAGPPCQIESHVAAHAPCLLDGLPPLDVMAIGATGAASVQWGDGGEEMRIGDAALARDALSSQGLATGASEAMYAAAIQNDRDRALLRLRQAEQRHAHLAMLAGVIESGRFADAPLWRCYRAFVRDAMRSIREKSSAALKDGRIVPATIG
jgi:flavin-dependent dehydrogenase